MNRTIRSEIRVALSKLFCVKLERLSEQSRPAAEIPNVVGNEQNNRQEIVELAKVVSQNGGANLNRIVPVLNINQ